MNSKLVDAIGLKTHAVALTWADAAPQGAIQFKPGRWGCVVSVFATVAAKGRVGAFDRNTYGCWGGGVGLGFCNCYENFPGGIEGFCHFLADGNDHSEEGQRVGEQIAGWGDRHLADDFLHGERYLKSAQVTRRFLEALPMRDIPVQYVVVKPLDASDPENDESRASRCSSILTNFWRSWFWRTIRSPILKMWRFRGAQAARLWASSPIVNWSESIPAHWWG